MTEQFFISNDEMRAIRALLREIPELIEDLAVTLTRQARRARGAGGGSGSDEQPLPFDVGASDASEQLRTELLGWVRHVNEYRGLAYSGPTSTLALAHWLEQHTTSLAMTEGCQDAYANIEAEMARCRRVCDRREDRAVLPIDEEKLGRARGILLNARGCAVAARAAGVVLTQRRVKHLADVGAVREVGRGSDGARLFRLGDVLDAHDTHPAA